MNTLMRKIANRLHIGITGVEPPKGFIATAVTLVMLLVLGTIFYSYQEGWSYFDAFYFSFVTITTVGYGDLAPTTVSSKVFTMFLIFMGVGLGLYVITTFADSFRAGREKRLGEVAKMLRKYESSDENQSKD